MFSWLLPEKIMVLQTVNKFTGAVYAKEDFEGKYRRQTIDWPDKLQFTSRI